MYNPVKAHLTIAGMREHHEKAVTAHQRVKEKREEFGVAINFRQELMDDIKTRATRMKNSLIAATDDEKIVADFNTVNRKSKENYHSLVPTKTSQDKNS